MKSKKQFRYFSIFNYEDEQEYLRKMQNDGWRFVKVSGPGIYHFEACEPRDVVYQLDYNPDGIKKKAEYIRLFEDCGWEYIQDYVGYSYFRKPASEMNGEEEIFCDDESRFQMMQRVYKGRLLPLAVLFFCILLPQLILNAFVYHNNIIVAIYAPIIALYLYIFVIFISKYRKLKKNIGK